jgi:hypothetical protein
VEHLTSYLEEEAQTVRGLAAKLNAPKPAITRALDRLKSRRQTSEYPPVSKPQNKFPKYSDGSSPNKMATPGRVYNDLIRRLTVPQMNGFINHPRCGLSGFVRRHCGISAQCDRLGITLGTLRDLDTLYR